MSVALGAPPRQAMASWSRFAATACVVGAVVALIALVFLPWFSLDGPNVYRAMADVPDPARGPIFLPPADVGRAHGHALWIGVGLSAVAALVALAPARRLSSAARGIAIVAGAFALLTIVVEVVIPTVAAEQGWLAPGVRIHLQPGFWLVVAGLVTVGVGAICGPRRFVPGETGLGATS